MGLFDGRKKKKEDKIIVSHTLNEEERTFTRDVRIDIPLYETEEQLRSSLEISGYVGLNYCFRVGGETYKALPVVNSLAPQPLSTIALAIHFQINTSDFQTRQIIEMITINAVYIGMYIGYLLVNNSIVSGTVIKKMFLREDTSPQDLPNNVIRYMASDIDSNCKKLLDKLLEWMVPHFVEAVTSTNRSDLGTIISRHVIAARIGIAVGYDFYFMLHKILLGKSSDEDQEILDKCFAYIKKEV